MRKFTTTILTTASLALASIAAVPAFAGPNDPLTFDVENPEVTFCGGSAKGNYYNVVGGTLQRMLQDSYRMGRATTAGTPEILNRVAQNQCNMGVVQADGLVTANFGAYEVFSSMYQEYVHLICSKQSGIEGVRDLHSNQDVVIGFSSMNSGGAGTWNAMGTLDDGYSRENGPRIEFVRTARVPSKLRAGGSNGGIDCFMHVTGLGDSGIAELGRLVGDDAELVPFNDHDFDDARLENGDRLYNWADIPEGTYDSLGNESGWGDHSVSTISVGAVLIANSQWLNVEAPVEMGDSVFSAVDYAFPHIQQQMAE